MPSISAENYLKNIYELESGKKKVTTSRLASKLKISPASVTDMVKKLSEKGFLRHEPYKGVAVTEKGKRSALQIIRKHRLWEMFLAEVLHFSWDTIHEEAEEFEHIMSERMEEKIDEVLGYPKVDPHGDPIPQKDGTIATMNIRPLGEAGEGMTVRVLRVHDANPELLQYASSIGLSLNKRIFVKQKNKFDDSLVVKIGTRETVVSSVLAKNIFIEA
ncbi:MAG TPA: metal-dependent transcriptional regulator [Bacteroidota bacterium]|nr:metal-dependent transcriptional regulator [Bacteroidota bacterium]